MIDRQSPGAKKCRIFDGCELIGQLEEQKEERGGRVLALTTLSWLFRNAKPDLDHDTQYELSVSVLHYESPSHHLPLCPSLIIIHTSIIPCVLVSSPNEQFMAWWFCARFLLLWV